METKNEVTRTYSNKFHAKLEELCKLIKNEHDTDVESITVHASLLDGRDVLLQNVVDTPQEAMVNYYVASMATLRALRTIYNDDQRLVSNLVNVLSTIFDDEFTFSVEKKLPPS